MKNLKTKTMRNYETMDLLVYGYSDKNLLDLFYTYEEGYIDDKIHEICDSHVTTVTHEISEDGKNISDYIIQTIEDGISIVYPEYQNFIITCINNGDFFRDDFEEYIIENYNIYLENCCLSDNWTKQSCYTNKEMIIRNGIYEYYKTLYSNNYETLIYNYCVYHELPEYTHDLNDLEDFDRLLSTGTPKKYYVTMTDTFLSDWGNATNKYNKLVIVCDSLDDAEIVKDNALNRTDMKYVRIAYYKPSYFIQSMYDEICRLDSKDINYDEYDNYTYGCYVVSLRSKEIKGFSNWFKKDYFKQQRLEREQREQ